MKAPERDYGPIFHEAVNWIDRFRNGQGDTPALFRWLAESPRHVEEFLVALSLTDTIAQLDPDQRASLQGLVSSLDHSQQSSEVVVPLRPRSFSTFPMTHGIPFNRRAGKFVTGCVALLLLVAAWYFADPARGWEQIATETGDQRAVVLDDGSVVHMNTQSTVRVKFSDRVRDVQLVSGEAMFTVSHDAQRPFRVHVDRSIIRAVGTQFNIRHDGTFTRVSVLEGVVEITRDEHGTSGSEVATLRAGEQVKIAADGSLTRQILTDGSAVGAWRERRLVFHDQTLQDIVAEFNRYTRKPQLRIDSDALGQRRYTGSFNAHDIDALVQLLSLERDVVVERHAQEIVIRLKP